MILVTGGTGFVGRHLVKSLAAAGQRVRVLSRRPADHAAVPAGVEIVQGDLAEPSSLDRVLAGADTVVNLAARLPLPGTAALEMERVNTEGTSALARAARSAGVAQFVHVSSASVYCDSTSATPLREADPPDPDTAYGRSKLAGEAAVRAEFAGSTVRWTIVRPAGVYGAGRPLTWDLFRQVARRRVWLHGPVPVIVHPTYVDDAVAAIRLILARTDLCGQTFHVAGERPLDYAELIGLIAERMGRRITQLRAPRWTSDAAGVAAGAVRSLGFRVPGRLASLARPLVSRALDTTKARRELGFVPVPLTRGLDETAAAVRAGMRP